MGKKTKLIHAWNIASLYSNVGIMKKFISGIECSNIIFEEDMILKPYSGKEMSNIDTFGNPFLLIFNYTYMWFLSPGF